MLLLLLFTYFWIVPFSKVDVSVMNRIGVDTVF